MSMRRIVYLLSLMMITVFCFSVKAMPTGTLPLLDTFDQEALLNKLPEGWASIGAAPFKVGQHNEGWVKPYSAPYYLMTSPGKGTSNTWVFTPGFQMSKGHTYSLRFWLLAPGFYTGGVESENIKITYGDAQTAEAQVHVIEDMKKIPNPNKKIEWFEITTSFVPQEDGFYCIGINAYNATGNGLGIDDFDLYDVETPPTAIPKFISDGGIWSATTEGTANHLRYIYPDMPIKFKNQSKYATSYSWDTLGDPTTTTEENPTVWYSQTGTYEVVLSATNRKSTEIYKENINVNVLGKENVSALISNRGQYDNLSVPETVEGGAYWDYIQGISKYSNTFAEKIELPDYATASISEVLLMLYDYKLAYPDYQKSVTVKICGDKYGMPDMSNVFGLCRTTMVDAFGDEDILVLPDEPVKGEESTRTIKFSAPVEVKGSFYIVYEIDANVVANASTIMGLLSIYKDNLKTNAYINLGDKAAEELSITAGWYRADKLPKKYFPDYSLEGLSLYIAPRMRFHPISEVGVKENTYDNGVKIIPIAFKDEFSIEVQGEPLQLVEIFNINGQKVYEVRMNENKITVPASTWSNGVYIVKTKGCSTSSSTKVVKF